MELIIKSILFIIYSIIVFIIGRQSVKIFKSEDDNIQFLNKSK